MKRFIKSLTIICAVLAFFIMAFNAHAVFAATQGKGTPNSNNAGTPQAAQGSDCDPTTDGLCPSCSYSSGTACVCPPNCGDSAATTTSKCNQSGCDLIDKYVNPFINLFTVTFGLVAVISIILGAIQYITSEGDPQKSAAAKNRITKTIFAVLAYSFLFGFLQFIIPGGTFR